MTSYCDNSESAAIRFRFGLNGKWQEFRSEHCPLEITSGQTEPTNQIESPNDDAPSIPATGVPPGMAVWAYRVRYSERNYRVVVEGVGSPFPDSARLGNGINALGEWSLLDVRYTGRIYRTEGAPPSPIPPKYTARILETGELNVLNVPSTVYIFARGRYEYEPLFLGYTSNDATPPSPDNDGRPHWLDPSIRYYLKSVSSTDETFYVTHQAPIEFTVACDCEPGCLLVEDYSHEYEPTCICSELEEEDMTLIKAQVKAELLQELPALWNADIAAAINEDKATRPALGDIIIAVKTSIINDTEFHTSLLQVLSTAIAGSVDLKNAVRVALGLEPVSTAVPDLTLTVQGVAVTITQEGSPPRPTGATWSPNQDDEPTPSQIISAVNGHYTGRYFDLYGVTYSNGVGTGTISEQSSS